MGVPAGPPPLPNKNSFTATHYSEQVNELMFTQVYALQIVLVDWFVMLCGAAANCSR